jgi:hypothetical protein
MLPAMIEGWVLWLFLAGLGSGVLATWLLVGRLPRQEGDVGEAERPAEAAWISSVIERHGGIAPASLVEEVLDLHQTYLERIRPRDEALRGDPTYTDPEPLGAPDPYPLGWWPAGSDPTGPSLPDPYPGGAPPAVGARPPNAPSSQVPSTPLPPGPPSWIATPPAPLPPLPASRVVPPPAPVPPLPTSRPNP